TLSYSSSPTLFFPILSPRTRSARSLVIETTTVAEAQTSEEARSESVARRLILLRHAKSSWDDRSLRDHDRPLSKAGQADAIAVSHKLQQLGWIPELILSSDAVRTKETLKTMQEQVRGFLEAEVHFISSFYSIAAMDGQTAEHLQHAICKFSRDEILTVMCMGHNRGWEEAASMFSGTSIELKTCMGHQLSSWLLLLLSTERGGVGTAHHTLAQLPLSCSWWQLLLLLHLFH
ncbi:uncharacterized protein At3g52155, chloroplastic-like, partial [Camellia sinensis]|uniref:uncharacterized protein At3g52155, chloroplastic-like n=1 Tax=Camellia sinensis TaxID=4442 RepID=UPI001035E3E3